MSKINDLIVAESENYISALLAEKLPENFIFHNLGHTLMVRKYAETIGESAGLTAEEMNFLRISALFLDPGYVNSFEKHHEESIALASAFLAEHGVDQQSIDHISEIIRATKIPQSPQDKIAEVLCDADMMYIAAESGMEQLDLLFDEIAMQKQNLDKSSSYEKKYINFLTTHTYFTEYGKTILQPKKEAAVIRIAERMKRRRLIEKKSRTIKAFHIPEAWRPCSA
jgi:HD superfamily phosphodiesterase